MVLPEGIQFSVSRAWKEARIVEVGLAGICRKGLSGLSGLSALGGFHAIFHQLGGRFALLSLNCTKVHGAVLRLFD